MSEVSRRRFMRIMAATGGAFICGRWDDGMGVLLANAPVAPTEEPIKIGIIAPLSGPFTPSSIHDVHGAHLAVEMFNKNRGVLGRPVATFVADDASNPELALQAATKFVQEDRVDVLMGTINADCALVVSDYAKQENKLFMVTGSHLPELSGVACNSHTFVFMPNATMMSRAVVPHLVKAYGTKWYMITSSSLDGKAMAQAMLSEGLQQGVDLVGEAMMPFGSTDFTDAFAVAKNRRPSLIVLNLCGWDLIHALRAYAKLELVKEKIGVGGMIGAEQIGGPPGYTENTGIWGLVWDPKINTEGSRRFIQSAIDKYNQPPTSRCYLGYAAMTQILAAMQRAGTTETSSLLYALEGHEFDGLKEGKSVFRASDHQHVQDVLVGNALGKDLDVGHYQILASMPGEAIADSVDRQICMLRP